MPSPSGPRWDSALRCLNNIPPKLSHLSYSTACFRREARYLLSRSHGALPTEGRTDHYVFTLATALMVWVCWTAASRYWSSRLWEGNNSSHGRAQLYFLRGLLQDRHYAISAIRQTKPPVGRSPWIVLYASSLSEQDTRSGISPLVQPQHVRNRALRRPICSYLPSRQPASVPGLPAPADPSPSSRALACPIHWPAAPW